MDGGTYSAAESVALTLVVILLIGLDVPSRLSLLTDMEGTRDLLTDVSERAGVPAPLRRQKMVDPCIAGVASRPRRGIGGQGAWSSVQLRSGPGS